MLKIDITGDGIMRMAEAVEAIGSEQRARLAYARTLNHTGRVAQTQVGRALSKQTGLKTKVTRKAVSKVERASKAKLQFVIKGSGGDVSLKHFGARETRKGVSAAPFRKRQVFKGTFIKGGLFPNRKDIGRGGQVFKAISGTRWGRPMARVRSGVVIPQEMVKGESASAFQQTAARLGPRLRHEIARLTKGAVT